MFVTYLWWIREKGCFAKSNLANIGKQGGQFFSCSTYLQTLQNLFTKSLRVPNQYRDHNNFKWRWYTFIEMEILFFSIISYELFCPMLFKFKFEFEYFKIFLHFLIWISNSKSIFNPVADWLTVFKWKLKFNFYWFCYYFKVFKRTLIFCFWSFNWGVFKLKAYSRVYNNTARGGRHNNHQAIIQSLTARQTQRTWISMLQRTWQAG